MIAESDNDFLITVIIPCRNEAGHIGEMLNSVTNQDVGLERLEILVSDGMSDDGTQEVVTEYSQRHHQIKLIPNPERVVPYALNHALKVSSGAVVVRMDAHSKYPVNYISRLIEVLLAEGADNTGGVWDTQPGADTAIARAVVHGTTSRFGIGNAQYRLGGENVVPVDTVPFGCYRKEVFERIGGFDTDMIRNQDDEFNARLLKSGGKILLVPDVAIKYFARPSLRKASKMFYQYGLFKPLVVKKTGGAVTWRQFIPLGFVLGNALGMILGFIHPLFWALIIVGNVFHLGIGALIGLQIAKREKEWVQALLVPVVVYSIHVAYGIGYLVGIVRFLVFRNSPDPERFQLSR